MTWQRIDENIYIDETLVTCAEYQLFIDEMHEQGKYYQPDHWTSSQFPNGQAREPISGVRHSDALAFCEWLTRRGGDEWIYRLPLSEDAINFPMETVAKAILGYWATENSEPKFIWLDNPPKNPRNLSSELLRKIDNLDDEHIYNAYGEAVTILTVQDRKASITKRIEEPLNLDIYSSEGVDIEFLLRRKVLINRAIEEPLNLDIIPSKSVDIEFLLDDIRRTERVVYSARFLVDLITLQERIAGRSPAFEGICLVKERVG